MEKHDCQCEDCLTTLSLRPCPIKALTAERDRAISEHENIAIEFTRLEAERNTLHAKNAKLREALERLLKKHVELVNCGDCGFWNVEEEEEVINARTAIKEGQDGD